MIAKVKTFIEEVIAEMQKVTWTTRKDLINSALIVIMSSVCLGVFITLTDLLLSRGLKLIVR
ncbi:MAG: preprotein translocase subunit SecE [Candidatus Omnitrophica bacterium]|nr:preprotein translocase subunit SecE [Candidatus Omnitrophota bacterium]